MTMPRLPMSPDNASMDQLIQEFDRCTPMLEPALDRSIGGYLMADILNGIIAGQLQFWPGTKTAAVTEIKSYPRLIAVHVFLAGGGLQDCVEWGEGPLAEWAKKIGAGAITAEGRQGWARVLPDARVLHTTIVRKLQ